MTGTDLMVIPEGWWWMSFADGAKPAGEQFLGVCIVYGPDFEGAHSATWFYDLNPGGELLGQPIPKGLKIGLNLIYRCLSYAETLIAIKQLNADVAMVAVPREAFKL